MERLPLHRKGIEFIHLGQDPRFQRVTSGTERIQRLAVTVENGLLAFVHDQLAAGHNIRQRMLPYKGFVVALIGNDGRNAAVMRFRLFDLCLYVCRSITDRTNDRSRTFFSLKLTAAGAAAEVNQIASVGVCLKGSVTDGTFCAIPLCLIIHNHIAA